MGRQFLEFVGFHGRDCTDDGTFFLCTVGHYLHFFQAGRFEFHLYGNGLSIGIINRYGFVAYERKDQFSFFLRYR